MSPHQLGDLTRLPPFSDETRWAEVKRWLTGRPFLRSEGLAAELAPPTRASSALVAQSRELVRRFDTFYRAVVDAKGELARDPSRQIDAPYEALAAAEGDRPPLPMCRFDCVLDAHGVLRVVELNPVGVCTLHLRSASYLHRALLRTGHVEAAAAVDELSAVKVRAIGDFIRATLARPPERPTIGLLLLPNNHRGSRVFWVRELESAGFRVVLGHPEDLILDGRTATGKATVRGIEVDAVWADWFLYIGYQQRRYEQTRFVSKMGNFSKASAASEHVLALPGLTERVADRSLTLLSPLRSYRAISKALLAWIERPELEISDEDRRYLRAHVARTWDHRQRLDGVLTPEQARKDREELLMKPCRFGGSYGVSLGRETDAESWARRLDEIWADPEWIIQAFHDPVMDERGARLSHGIYSYDGALGGLLVRAAPERVVSARNAEVIIAATGPATAL